MGFTIGTSARLETWLPVVSPSNDGGGVCVRLKAVLRTSNLLATFGSRWSCGCADDVFGMHRPQAAGSVHQCLATAHFTDITNLRTDRSAAAGDIEVNDAPAIVRENHKAVEHSKRCGGNCEEVTGCNL